MHCDVAIFSVGKAITSSLMTSDPIVTLLCLKSLACHRHPAFAEEHIFHGSLQLSNNRQYSCRAIDETECDFPDEPKPDCESKPKLWRLGSRSSWKATSTAMALSTSCFGFNVILSRNEQLRDSVLAGNRVSTSFDRPGCPGSPPTTFAFRPVEFLAVVSLLSVSKLDVIDLARRLIKCGLSLPGVVWSMLVERLAVGLIDNCRYRLFSIRDSRRSYAVRSKSANEY